MTRRRYTVTNVNLSPRVMGRTTAEHIGRNEKHVDKSSKVAVEARSECQ